MYWPEGECLLHYRLDCLERLHAKASGSDDADSRAAIISADLVAITVVYISELDRSRTLATSPLIERIV